MAERMEHRSDAALLDRAVGALVGLAVGDAVGTTLEFTAKPAEPVLFDMVGGGPFRMPAGGWTDDTSMALALADSLLHDPDLDPKDLMDRFAAWYQRGEYSHTGTCFDIGNTVRGALGRYRETGDPVVGSTDPFYAGNGALMRLAPVAVRHPFDAERRRRVAALQTRTTHGAAEAVAMSELYADLIAALIAGQPVAAVLDAAEARLPGWRGARRHTIRGSGYVMHSATAALWAFSQATDFREAVLLAANLGEDADTTAAITGQLAGAAWGMSGIPAEWLERLLWRERIEEMACRLAEAGLGDRI